MKTPERRAWLSWASVGLLAALCGVLALLQNHWIREISRAEKERLQNQLQSELMRLSREFNTELASACFDLVPTTQQVDELGRMKAYALRYSQWRESHDRLFSRIAVVVPDDDSLEFYDLDLASGQFAPGEWPPSWTFVRNQLLAHLTGGPFDMATAQRSTLIDVPRFDSPRFGPHPPGPPRHGPPPFGPSGMRPRPDGPEGMDRRGFGRLDRGGRGPGVEPGPRGRAEQDWLILQVNVDYVRETMLPELLHRHLGGGGKLDYEAKVVDAADPSHVIFEITPHSTAMAGTAPDASVSLFAVNGAAMNFRDRSFGRGRRPGPPEEPGPGRWHLLVRHQAGSLEAVVARARWHNLAISAGILLLILATGSALVRFSRQVHQLAELQMNFVAGVSHELRTPLTVIRTAAFNLRGKLATKPEQVERYGKLIQDESEKLAALVDQVLRFASTRAGRVIQERGPVDVELLIEEGLRSSRAATSTGVIVEKHVDPGLPPVLADEMAMKHALQNLVENALKYGTEGSNWIGVFASAVQDGNGPAVEIRVADRGPGIPPEEQERIFDPFFRGRRAVQDQVHGTGLGLNLVKKIVEAHGGTIEVKSEPMKGTEFVMRIPAAPAERRDEFAHSIS